MFVAGDKKNKESSTIANRQGVVIAQNLDEPFHNAKLGHYACEIELTVTRKTRPQGRTVAKKTYSLSSD